MSGKLAKKSSKAQQQQGIAFNNDETERKSLQD
jgi:hypothetical protein